MAIYGSVQITGFIAPTYSGDTYATHDAYYGRDGLRNVDTESELDEITALRRRAGMIVGVSGGTKHYRLLPEPWSFTFSDWDVAFLTPSQAAGAFTGNTSATCITDLWVSNIHGCSPITIHDSIQYNGSIVSGDSAFAFGTSVSALTSNGVAFGQNSLAQASQIVQVPTLAPSIYSGISISIDPTYSTSAITFTGINVETEWYDYLVNNGLLSSFIVTDGIDTQIVDSTEMKSDKVYFYGGNTYIVLYSLTASSFTTISGTGYYNVATLMGKPAFAFGINSQSLGVGSVSNGTNTVVQTPYSNIDGGKDNQIIGIEWNPGNNIAGGIRNTLTSTYSANIGGGCYNRINNPGGWIANINGGYNNYINGQGGSGWGSTIGGGSNNTVYASYGTIGGGQNNLIRGKQREETNAYSFIGGGSNNKIGAIGSYGKRSSIVGGQQNTINDSWASSIVGGYLNETKYSVTSFIGGGFSNTIMGASHAVIGAGFNNLITGSSFSSILGGTNNKVNGTSGTTTNIHVIGSSITASTSNTTYVNSLYIDNIDNNTPLKVVGNSGDLFTVTDSLIGSLFSVNDISGLPVIEAFDDSTILMGSYTAPSLNTTKKVNLNTGTTTVYSIPTSAYTGGFFDYTLSNTGGVRAGTVMSVWSGTSAQYIDTPTSSIGDTSQVTLSVGVSGSNAVFSSSATTANWVIKTIIRSI